MIHQPNSGGPAGPCNRALDVATGRYVFFVGADDYLGLDALRRLVAAADTHGSDVVLGKIVGVNSRSIYQDIFARSAVDVGLHDSPLPRSLGNTKLFRRELLDRHGIRYPEHMPVASDLPFTLEACYRARRVSVLADYDYYYLVRRLNEGNISYTKRYEQRLPGSRRGPPVHRRAHRAGPTARRRGARPVPTRDAGLLGDQLLQPTPSHNRPSTRE